MNEKVGTLKWLQDNIRCKQYYTWKCDNFVEREPFYIIDPAFFSTTEILWFATYKDTILTKKNGWRHKYMI
jgi:hypothetical protein